MKKILAIYILLLGFVTNSHAQTAIGTTGLINIPTADMQHDGTFMGGATFLPDSYLSDRFNFNTGMYYINFTPFKWAEITLRETLFKGRQQFSSGTTGDVGYYFQDRSYTVRIAPLFWVKNKWIPKLVIGTNDPWSDNGGSYYSCIYGVATEHFHINKIGDISASFGYFKSLGDCFGENNTKTYSGIFGGISYTPAFWDKLMLCADYDTQGFNIGANVRLFNHWNIFVYERDFNKFGGGMSYQFTIKY